MVVIIEQGKSGVVIFNHTKHLFGIKLVLGTFHDAYHLSKLLQTLVVDGVAFDDIFRQDRICPFTESYASFRFNPVTYGNNHIEIVIFCLFGLRFTFHSTVPGGGRKFCDYHLPFQFFTHGIVDMLTNGLYIPVEQNGHLLSVKPYCFFFG